MSSKSNFNFDHLDVTAVREGEAPPTHVYELYQIQGYKPKGQERRTAKLVGCFAGEGNKPYHKSLMTDVAKGGAKKARRSANRIDVNILRKNRSRDRVLFPKFVIMEMIDIQNTEGELVPSGPEAIAELCEKLPDWIFDEVRDAFAEPTNFIEDSVEYSIHDDESEDGMIEEPTSMEEAADETAKG